MTSATSYIITSDGTVLIRDLISGAMASGRTLPEAFAELRRLTARGAPPAHRHASERDAVATCKFASCLCAHPAHGNEGAAA